MKKIYITILTIALILAGFALLVDGEMKKRVHEAQQEQIESLMELSNTIEEAHEKGIISEEQYLDASVEQEKQLKEITEQTK